MVFILPLAAFMAVSCAGRKETVFSSVPGPSPGIAGSLPPAPPVSPAPEPKKPVPAPVTETKKAPAKKPDLIVTPERGLSGKVVTYNDTGRFVVVDFPTGNLPAADRRMFVYRSGLKVGEVKINSWQHKQNN